MEHDPFFAALMESICGEGGLMDQATFLDAMRAVHFLGLAMGFGLALFADICAVRAIVRPMKAMDIAFLWRLHHAVCFGLVLLWASGLMLLLEKTGLVASEFSPKLLAKLVVVSLLTANAVLIGGYVLPVFQRLKGMRFCDLALRQRLALSGVAGISLSCWSAALILGTFTATKTMPFETLAPLLGTIFFVGCLMATAAAILAPVITELLALKWRSVADDSVWSRRLSEAPVEPTRTPGRDYAGCFVVRT